MTTNAAVQDPADASHEDGETPEEAAPATLAEAEALLACLEQELRWHLPEEEAALRSELKDCTMEERARELRDLLSRNAARNNALVLRLIPEAEAWVAEQRRHDAAAAERAEVAAILAGADLQDTIAAAVRSIGVLEGELASLPSQLREAARSADAHRMIELRHRRDALPDELFAERAVLSRLQAARLDAVAEQARAAQPAAKADLERAEAAFATAQETVAAARGTYRRLVAEEQEARSNAQAQRRYLEDVMSEQATAGLGPVVRSAWQGGG